jgi:uncharacterized protein (UPF0332 family)
MIHEAEIDALLNKAKRSLLSSFVMLKHGDYDFAISRAYYAMFYCAEALLFSKDLTFSKHSAVIAFFGKEFVKSGIFSKDIYSHLTDGFTERQICDYDAMIMPKAEDAERIINGAKIFIEAACVYLKIIGYEIGMVSR